MMPTRGIYHPDIRLSLLISSCPPVYTFTREVNSLSHSNLNTDFYDVNVSPDKRTIFLHSEKQLVEALKVSSNRMEAGGSGSLCACR